MTKRQAIIAIYKLLLQKASSVDEEKSLHMSLISFLAPEALGPQGMWVSLIIDFAHQDPRKFVDLLLPHSNLFSVGGDLLQHGNLKRSIDENDKISISVYHDNGGWFEIINHAPVRVFDLPLEALVSADSDENVTASVSQHLRQVAGIPHSDLRAFHSAQGPINKWVELKALEQ
jgi:hypothetical protein